MSNTRDFLFEIGCEELPPQSLKTLSLTLTQNIITELKNAELSFNDFESFATPRRLAVIIKGLVENQPAQKIERKGPAINMAFDNDGNPTQACIGFAKSCNVAVADLAQHDGKLYFYQEKPAEKTATLLPG